MKFIAVSAHFMAALLLTTLLTACGGAQTQSATDADTLSQVDALPDSNADASAMELNHSLRRAGQGGYEQFVLEGHEVLGSEEGDLNKDKYPDRVLALKQVGEADVSDDNPAPRPLLLLLGQPDGSLKLAARNDKVVLCQACGGVFGDPFDGIAIKDGYFSIEHYGGSNWRWTRIITFKWSEEDMDWLLHKDGGVSYHTSDPDKTDESVKTVKDFGRVPFGKFSYGE